MEKYVYPGFTKDLRLQKLKQILNTKVKPLYSFFDSFKHLLCLRK